MHRTAVLLALLAGTLVSACGSPPPIHPSSSATSSASGQGERAWVAQAIDPAPGPTVTGAIAEALGGPRDEVVAAVFLLDHPAGNRAEVWVFEAGELSSGEALERWAVGAPTCVGTPTQGSLAGRDTVMIRRKLADQCQPQYLVRLDDQRVAVITDDGGYSGNDADPPTRPYRPASDIEWIVTWIQDQLTTVELQPGGPPMVQGRVAPTLSGSNWAPREGAPRERSSPAQRLLVTRVHLPA